MAGKPTRLPPRLQIELAEPIGATFKPYLLTISPISGNLAGFAVSNAVP
jgi:hypothetical protein